MEVKLIKVGLFGRVEFKPGNELARIICEWLKQSHITEYDKNYIEKIGLKPVLIKDCEKEG